MKRHNYKKFASMTPEQIGKLKKSEMRELLSQARAMYETRSAQLNKQGRYFYSPALEKIEEHYEENPMVDINKLTRNRAMAEVFLIQDFFRARTSSLKGAREVMAEQDSRIFGVSEKGKPLHRLTRDQRTKFWGVYSEFTSQFKNSLAKYGSDVIQQYLGERVVSTKGRKLGIDMDTLNSIWEGLQARETAEGSQDASRNVFTGRRRNNRNR